MNMYKILKSSKKNLTKQQYKTLKGQVIAGDKVGALKGLNKILNRQSNT